MPTCPHSTCRPSSVPRSAWGAVVAAAVCLLLHEPRAIAAEPYRLSFDDPLPPSWSWQGNSADVKLLRQQRSRAFGRESGGEGIEFTAHNKDAEVRLAHRLPPCRALDELEVSLWVRAPQPGWTVAVRVVAPGIRDPVTGEAGTFLVRGDVLRDADRWQQLRCRTVDREVRQQIVWLRAKHSGASDPGELYVDQVLLLCHVADAAESSVSIDDLELSPVVPVTEHVAVEAPSVEVQIPAVEFHQGRLQVGGRPFFPRILRDHGEPAATLADTGCNLIWVEDDAPGSRLKGLQAERLWALATPPRPHDESGDPLGVQNAGLLPFHSAADPVLCWMMGIRLTGSDRERTVDWIEQVRAADRRRNRPIVAEVVDQERLYSRDVEMLGMSRHVLQSTFSLPEYRDWLAERRAQARPGAFCWTWIQCEPNPASLQVVSPWASPPQLEPEHIRLQVYAALTAGCRGIGFWTTQPIDASDPASQERWLAIKQINLELELLEPWLATVGSITRVPCQTASETPAGRTDAARRALDSAGAFARNLLVDSQGHDRNIDTSTGLTATVLQTEYGTLVLPVWLDPVSQLVPAQAAAHGISFVVPGAAESAAAYEISTTGITPLPRPQRDRPPGGMPITLPRFDQTAIVWLTSNERHVQKMRQRIAALQNLPKSSAAVSIELARRKLDRVGEVDGRLHDVGARQKDGPQIVGSAKLRLEKAQDAFQSRDYHAARVQADEALQSLRILQRAHWDDAVRHLTSPAGSPYTLCFQSLPDHWRLVGQLGRSPSRAGRNLLASGGFEDFDTLVAEAWQHSQSSHESLHSNAELVPGGRKSRYALRLTSVPKAGLEAPTALAQPPVTVSTPALPVRAGEILHISGWVKIDKPIHASRDGFVISESSLGRTGALRFREPAEWTRFELLREVVASSDWRLTFSLTGLGEVRLDDVQVLAFDALPDPEPTTTEPVIEPAGVNSLFNRLPKLPGLPKRRE